MNCENLDITLLFSAGSKIKFLEAAGKSTGKPPEQWMEDPFVDGLIDHISQPYDDEYEDYELEIPVARLSVLIRMLEIFKDFPVKVLLYAKSEEGEFELYMDGAVKGENKATLVVFKDVVSSDLQSRITKAMDALEGKGD